jgi:hypothetical protein
MTSVQPNRIPDNHCVGSLPVTPLIATPLCSRANGAECLSQYHDAEQQRYDDAFSSSLYHFIHLQNCLKYLDLQLSELLQA